MRAHTKTLALPATLIALVLGVSLMLSGQPALAIAGGVVIVLGFLVPFLSLPDRPARQERAATTEDGAGAQASAQAPKHEVRPSIFGIEVDRPHPAGEESTWPRTQGTTPPAIPDEAPEITAARLDAMFSAWLEEGVPKAWELRLIEGMDLSEFTAVYESHVVSAKEDLERTMELAKDHAGESLTITAPHGTVSGEMLEILERINAEFSALAVAGDALTNAAAGKPVEVRLGTRLKEAGATAPRTGRAPAADQPPEHKPPCE
jgi:hypothetical protein